VRCLALTAVLLLAALPAWGAAPPAETPAAAIDLPEVPTHQIGDWWRNDVQVDQRDAGGNRTRAHSLVTLTVANREFQVQGTRTYNVYNATLSGSIWGNGTFNLGGTPLTASDMAGTVGGYTWLDRGDLSLVRNNETSSLSGTIDIPLLGARPFQLQVYATTYHDPSREELDFPLRPPESWDIQRGSRTLGWVSYFVDMPFPLADLSGGQPIDQPDSGTSTAWVNGTGPVTVPAGTFDAFRLEYADGGGAAGASDTRWWAPEVRSFARTEVHVVNPGMEVHTWTNLTAYSLSPVSDSATMAVSPNPSSTCGDVTVSGSATVPSTPGTLWVGAVGFAYPAVTDGPGAYSTTFPVPAVPDFTPTALDYASHGLVIDVDDGLRRATNATTLTILRPDVGLAAADIAVTGTRIVGQTLDITATVHEATGAPYGCAFSVLIEVDGAPVANVTFGGIAAGGTVAPTGTWLAATPGLHTATVTVWPLDLETLTANNTANVTFLVQGPDLTFTGIAVDYASFPDTAMAGGRSGTVNANLGALVPVSFDVRNVGVLATVPTRLRAYNTTGEGGPQSDPAFLDGTTPALPPGGTDPAAFLWPAPAVPGTYHFTLEADADGDLLETDEANNTFFVTIATDGPDLTPVVTVSIGGVGRFFDPLLSGLFISPPTDIEARDTATITLTVRNVGNVAANESYQVAFSNTTGPGGPVVDTFQTATEAAPQAVGETRGPITAAWTAPAVFGRHHVNLTADVDGGVVERNEANNTFVLVFNVSAPDLVAVNASGPALVPEGTSLVATADTRNSGDYASGAFEYSWVLDGAVSVDPGTVPDLVPGATVMLNVTWVATVGNHTLCLRVDEADRVLELDESNNAVCHSIDVTGPPETALSLTGPQTGTDPVRISPLTEIVLTATDHSGTGIRGTWYSVDGASPALYTGPFTLTGEGSHTVDYNSTDNLGASDPQKLATLILDGTPPITNVTAERFPGRTEVNASVEDPSGIALFEVRLDDGPWQTVSGTRFNITVTEPGPHNLTVRARDALGNVLAEERHPFTVDPLPPTDTTALGLPWGIWVLLAAVILFIILLIAWWRRRKKPEEIAPRAVAEASEESGSSVQSTPPAEDPRAEANAPASEEQSTSH